MSDHLSRRALLAGLGTAALAGCLDTTSDASDGRSGGEPQSTPLSPTETPPPTETHPPTETPPPTGTGSRTPTLTPGSDTPTDAEPETTTSRTGATETDAPHGPTTTTSLPAPDPPSKLDTAWPVPAADPGLTNYASGATGPTSRPTELWRLAASASLSGPVLADGTVYVGADAGTVRALDGRSGEEQYEHSVGAAADTPWAVGDRLYVPTATGIVALSRSDGTEQWRVETPNRAAVLVADHGVYWLDESGPAIVALDRDSGDQRWRTPIDDPWAPTLLTDGDSVFVSSGTHDSRFWTLAIDSGDVTSKEPRTGNDFPSERCYTDGTVFSVDAFFGNVRANPVDEDGYSWSAGVAYGGGDGGGLLSAGADRVYYTCNVSDNPGLFALRKTDGIEVWTTDVAGTITGRPVVADETVLVPTDEGVRAYATTDGSAQWHHPDLGATLAVVDDLVYAVSDATLRALRPPE